MPAPQQAIPKTLEPYLAHGVDLNWKDGDREAVGDCPWCGREGKFSVSLETGLWKCWVCAEGSDKGGGNAQIFIEMLWKLSDENTHNYDSLAEDRRLAYPDTLMQWGVVQSILTHHWLVPGYGVTGKLRQLYRYVSVRDRMVLLPTPTLGHQLHGVNLYRSDCESVYLCEGPWDGMALWEAMGNAKPSPDGLTLTANRSMSLLSVCSVLAVPGANVFMESWLPLLAGKTVNILFDNDHPRVNPHTGKSVKPAGLDGTERIARLLKDTPEKPREINWLCWGEQGYNLGLPGGYDVRDYLNEIRQ